MSLFERVSLFKKKERDKPIQHKHTIGLSSALDTVEFELQKKSDNRIRTPFEFALKKGLVSLQDLKRWGSQKIEIGAAHDPDDTLIISTGSPTSYRYDWPDEAFGVITRRDKDKKLALEGIAQADARLFQRSRYDSTLYTIHNHPLQPTRDGGEEEIPIPSYGDIFVSAISRSEIDIILTPSCVVFYKNTDKDAVSREEYNNVNFYTLSEFLKSKGIIRAVVPFTDVRMQKVLDFMNGKISWGEAQKDIENS